MVYSGGYVVSIATKDFNGHWQFVKERADGIVSLAMGQEYAVYLRNKTSKGVLAQIFIDGENVSGEGYILRAGDSFHIMRYNKQDKAFKLVAHDSSEAKEKGKGYVSEGTRGVVEVRFYPEREVKIPPVSVMPIVPVNPSPWDNKWPINPYPIKHIYPMTHNSKRHYVSKGGAISAGCDFAPEINSITLNSLSDGVTVGGESTGQKFSKDTIDVEDEYISVVLTLKGDYNKMPTQPQSQFCAKCGARRKRKNSKFCDLCGQRL